MRKALLIVVLLVVAAASAGLTWWLTPAKPPADRLTLYGNIDLRQVDLPFNNNERISAVLVQEGDHVVRGQVLARLDTSRLRPQVEQVAVQVAAQQAVVERLHHGSRPEEIAQAEANVQSAKADMENAKVQLERLKSLATTSAGQAVSKQDIDNAQAAFDVASAKLAVNQKALDLAIAGPRKEDITQAEAQLKGYEAQLAFSRQQLADAELRAAERGGSFAPDGARRDGLAAEGGPHAGDHRSQVGARVRLRGRSRQGPSRHARHGDRSTAFPAGRSRAGSGSSPPSPSSRPSPSRHPSCAPNSCTRCASS